MIRSGLAALERLRAQGREAEYQERLRILERIVDTGLSGMERGEMLISIILRNIREERIDPAGFEPLSMAGAVRKALDGYAFSRDHRARLVLDLEQDFKVQGDENLLIYVVLNLLQNALRYVGDRPDGEVRIVLSRAGGQHRLLFSDNGPGIPPERIEGIFETFGTYGNKHGTGLGLPFCRRVMTAFGGEVSVRSRPGAGTELSLLFPTPRGGLVPPAAGQAPRPADPAQRLPQP